MTPSEAIQAQTVVSIIVAGSVIGFALAVLMWVLCRALLLLMESMPQILRRAVTTLVLSGFVAALIAAARWA